MELAQENKGFPPTPVKLSGLEKGSGFLERKRFIWNVRHVLRATGGNLAAGPDYGEFAGISIDSRTVQEGDLFLALVGENFDGHDFVEQASAKGAAGFLVSRLPDIDLNASTVRVEDTLVALGQLASYRRRLMPELGVIAITGSSGKTTVKEMCSHVLIDEFQVLKTEGNFNNLVGLPLTLLRLEQDHELAVLEMGMNHAGEIRAMTRIADPDLACIHNIQEAHLGGFGSLEGIKRAKEELFENCSATTRLCINLDDDLVRGLSKKYSQHQISYGRHRKADVRATHVRNLGEEGMAFTLSINEERRRLRLRFLGEHNVSNALAAAAISYGAGLRIDQIVRRLEQCQPYSQRFQVDRVGGLRLVNDCYNANPSSMTAALQTIRSLKAGRRSIAVLGDMMELGESAEISHLRLGEKVACSGFDFLIALGEFAHKTVEGALNGGMTMKQVSSAVASEEVLDRLMKLYHLREIDQGDWVLVKGSRGMKMEIIVEGLKTQLEM